MRDFYDSWLKLTSGMLKIASLVETYLCHLLISNQ